MHRLEHAQRCSELARAGRECRECAEAMFSLLDHRTALLLAPERLLWHIETELPRSLKSRDSASYETSEPASIASIDGLCSATLPESPREAWWVAARKALSGAWRAPSRR